MNLNKLNRNIKMKCPKCKNSKFEYDESDDSETQAVECTTCGRKTTKADLIKDNSDNIESHIKEIGEEAADEIAKEINKVFKNIKIKF